MGRNTERMIGLRPRPCIEDVACGRVNMDEIFRIFILADCKDADDWEKLVDKYSNWYWSDNPQISETMRKLIKANKLEQVKSPNDMPGIFEDWMEM